MSDESHVDQLIRQAESCLDKGDLPQARRLYTEICRARDDDAHAWLMFGAINGELGNVEVAQGAIERAVALDPEYAEAHLALAHLLKARAQFAQALAAALQAVAADAELVEGWLFVAATAGQLADWSRAEEACHHVIELAPGRLEGHVNLGNVLLATGRALQAEETFREALALGENAEASFGLGLALSALDRHADAEPALASALRLDVSNAGFREALANCLEHLGRSDESAAVRAGSTSSQG